MDDLLGREHDLTAIERFLGGGARLLTVCGPPGVGKSRLVREVAARRPGTIVCDLTTCRSAADVERALQVALGNVSRARLARVIAAQTGVVVLDRFEHLVGHAGALVTPWTSGTGPRFLVASREPLGVPGESTLVLGPLAEEDAISLYAARARRAIDRPTAAVLVRRLDRLPLAIELAAARASLLTDRELLGRLDRGIGAIDSASALRATILWSVDLLSPEERATLLQCAVFRAPFDARAAEAIVRADGDTIGHLVALERKGLLRRTPDTRVALYDAVREVALEQLAKDGAAEDTTLRHARYFLALAAEALASKQPLANEAPDLSAAWSVLREHDPIAATTLALALDLAVAGHAPSNAHLELLSSAVESAARTHDDALAAKALHARARAERLVGAARRAGRDLRAALMLARRARAPEVEADVLRLLGVVARQLSRPLRARLLLQHALELHEASGHTRGVAMVLDDLGVVAHDLGELAAARELYERALPLERIVGDRRFEGITLVHLGIVAHDLGDLDGADRLYREALARHRESGDRRFEGFAHAFLAALSIERADVRAARQSIDAAAAIDARLGDVDSGVLLAGVGCAVFAANGEIVDARELLTRARAELVGRDDTALRSALDVFGAALAVAEARRARAEGRVADVHLEAARAALTPGTPPRSVEERLARRLVGHLLDIETGARAATVIADDGSWFEAGGARTSLATRRALGLVLARLAHERRAAPGRSVGIDALFEAGWPGERVPAASARRRVYVGIDTLRSLGLRTAIVQRERGYLLDTTVQTVGPQNDLNDS